MQRTTSACLDELEKSSQCWDVWLFLLVVAPGNRATQEPLAVNITLMFQTRPPNRTYHNIYPNTHIKTPLFKLHTFLFLLIVCFRWLCVRKKRRKKKKFVCCPIAATWECIHSPDLPSHLVSKPILLIVIVSCIFFFNQLSTSTHNKLRSWKVSNTCTNW